MSKKNYLLMSYNQSFIKYYKLKETVLSIIKTRLLNQKSDTQVIHRYLNKLSQSLNNFKTTNIYKLNSLKVSKQRKENCCAKVRLEMSIFKSVSTFV